MFFVLSPAWDKEKKPYTELKTYYLSYSIYKHDAIDITDPSSIQDAYYMNFVIDLAHLRVCLAQWYYIGARNPEI